MQNTEIKNKKKNRAVRASKSALLCGLALMGGLGAAAWLSTSDTATTNQVINAGTFNVAFQNELSPILNEKAIPVTDAEGKATTPYTLDINNAGNIDALVRLSVEATKGGASTAMLPAEKVNVEIKEAGTGTMIYDGPLAGIKADTATYGAGEVMRIDGAQTKNLEVRAWIDDTAVNEDLYGVDGQEVRDVEMKVKLTAVQADGGLFTHGSDGKTEDSANTWESQWDAALTTANQ